MALLAAPAQARQSPEETPSSVAQPESSDTSSRSEVDDLFHLDQQLSTLRVVTASQQAEPLKETPVPVTVITAEMMRSIGARTLQDVLLAYVPGMTPVEDQNEMNVAMHGIYGSSQQKILILLDGHRLNNRAYSSANPDYGISLDKVKQVEVLRGPGSSLYGNVALTAVVNLVTKGPEDLDGAQVRLAGGNYGQKVASLLYDREVAPGSNLLLWGQVAEVDGETRAIPANQVYSAQPTDSTAILGGTRLPVPYDVGLKYRVGDFSLLANASEGSYVEPFSSAGTTGEPYGYGSYRPIEGQGPGIGQRYTHLELKYARPIDDQWSVEATAGYDNSTTSGLLVSAPLRGGATYITWTDDAFNGRALVRYAYSLGKGGTGNVTAGVEVDAMRLLGSNQFSELGGEITTAPDTSQKPLLERGREIIYSGYTQIRHRLTDQLIFNVGGRFDHKERHRGPDVNAFSPRLAVIYTPSDLVDVKVGYAESFVDAPYWYRYNSLPSYRGSAGLTPEHLSSVNANPTLHLFGGKLTSGVNLFYNDAYDLIFRNNNALPTEPIYRNSGNLKTVGVEEELALLQSFFRVHGNATFQHVLNARDYNARGNRIFNVPRFMANVILDVNPFRGLFEKSWFTVAARYVGKELSPINVTYAAPNGTTRTFSDPGNFIGDYVRFDAGVHITDVGLKGLSVDGTVYNLLDKRYQQGGSTVHPYPQPGRWFLVSVAYKFLPTF